MALASIVSEFSQESIPEAANSAATIMWQRPSRLTRSRPVRCASPAEDGLRLRYELDSREVEIDDDDGRTGVLSGYLTEEVAPEGHTRPTRACILLPDAAGWRDPPVRRLADRIAVFCACLVLVPDLLRTSAPWPAELLSNAGRPMLGDDAYASWLAGQPPQRVASDVRTSLIYLRADHRVGPVGLFGAGLGGGQVLASLSTPSIAAAAVLCPTSYDTAHLRGLDAPLLCVFGLDERGDEQA